MSAEAWTDDRVEKLKAMVEQGASAGEIEAALDCGISRNAVIGKVHRLKLAFKNGRGASPGKPHRPRAAVPSRPPLFDVRLPASDVSPITAAIEPIQIVAVEASAGGVDHDGLKPHHCRWPSGDPRSPDFRYCGVHHIEGKPYCAHHDRKSVDPTRRV